MFNPKDQSNPPRSLLSMGPRESVGGRREAKRPEVRDRAEGRRRNPLLEALAALPDKPTARQQAPAEPRAASPGNPHTSVDATPQPSRPEPRREERPASSAQSEQPRQPAPPPAPEPELEAAAPTERRQENDDRYWRPLIDPMKVIGGVIKSRYIILATTVAGALLGVAIALSTPKKYEAVAEILVDPRDIKISERQVTETGLPSDATLAIVENQVRVMTSGLVLNKVVDQLNLTADPEFNGSAGGFGIGMLISEIRGLFSRGDGRGGDVRRALAIRNLARSLDVERGGRTFVVTVGVKTEDAAKSALIANTVTSVFLESYGDIQAGTAGRAADELTSRLAELQSGLETAERKVEAFKSENDLIDAQGRLISDDEIVKLNEQLSVARARTIELNARAASTRNLDLDSVVGGELPEQISSPVMAELRTQYATAKQEVDRMSTRLGPRHPERLAAEAQLQGARESMASELRRIVSSIQVDLRRAVQLEQDLASRLAQLKARQAGFSDKLVTLRELEREAAAKRAVYESYLLRARETGEARGINTANVSVISEAQPPLDPLGPSRTMIVLAATMLGMMAGIGIGGLRGAVDSVRGGSPARPTRPAPTPVAARPARREPVDMPAPRSPDPVDPPVVPANDPAPAVAAEPPQPRSPSETPPPAQEDTTVHPYPYPQYPQASPAAPGQDPHAEAARQWYEQQAMAAHHHAMQQAAAQQAMARQGWNPAQGWPYAPPPQPYGAAGYPPFQQSSWPPYQGQAWQPWAPSAPPTPGAWPAQHAAPADTQRRDAAQRADPSAVDEIRESLREFREAVRDLAERRGRTRDW